MTNCCNQKKYCYEYPRPVLSTDVIVCSSDGKVLLIKRNIEPYKDCWALPGGHVGDDENSEMACKRELKEETGLELNEIYLVGIAEEKNRDPRREYTISIVYAGYTDGNPIGGDDASEAKWFSLDEITKLELAFDHNAIMNKFIHMCACMFGGGRDIPLS